MSIVWLTTLIQTGFAEPTYSIALQTRTTPSSLGFQRYHSGLGFHRQDCGSTNSIQISDCWRLKGGWGQRSDQIPDAVLRTHSLNVDVQRGLWFSGELLDVGFFAGFGVTSMVGGFDSLAIQTIPQIHTELQVQRTTSKERTLWISGQSILYWSTLGSQIQVGWVLPW